MAVSVDKISSTNFLGIFYLKLKSVSVFSDNRFILKGNCFNKIGKLAQKQPGERLFFNNVQAVYF